MPDWTKAMQQYYEFYTVNPDNWENDRMLHTVTSASISRDLTSDTLASATFETTELVGEQYIRVYFITIQNGITERFPLGTYLVQSPSVSFNGMVRSLNLDAYSPILELREKYPTIGYTVRKGTNIMGTVTELAKTYMRAPVVGVYADNRDSNYQTELINNYTADTDDTWYSFISKLAAKAGYSFMLDEYGRLCFKPIEYMEAAVSKYTFNDDNSSILCKDLSIDKDIYGIPNVVMVYKTTDTGIIESVAENHEQSSPVSIEARGRRIEQRIMNPEEQIGSTQVAVDNYAQDMLRKLSAVSYTIDFTHGYCPVNIGDWVTLNYTRAGLNNVKAKIISQTIDCKPGCLIKSKAIYSEKLYEADYYGIK